MEPDGADRCGRHSQDPRCAKSRSGGNPKRAQIAQKNRAKVAKARRAGKLPPEPVKDGRGDKPWKADLDALEAAEVLEPAAVLSPAPDVSPGDGDADGAMPTLLEEGQSAGNASDRIAVVDRVLKALSRGTIPARVAEAIWSGLKVAAAETDAGSRASPQVRFLTVQTRRDAEALTAGEYGPIDARELN